MQVSNNPYFGQRLIDNHTGETLMVIGGSHLNDDGTIEFWGSTPNDETVEVKYEKCDVEIQDGCILALYDPIYYTRV